jgi:hypothetical protein
VGLVLGEALVAERRPFEIPRDADVLGLLVVQQLSQHARESEHGIRGKAIGVRQTTDGEERPEELRGPVDEIERAHKAVNANPAAALCLAQVPLASEHESSIGRLVEVLEVDDSVRDARERVRPAHWV